VAVVFLATLVRSAFGFGEALVAVPLLALRIPVRIAAPLAVLVSITVAAVVLVQDRHHVERRSAAWLVLATVAGVPLGLLLLTRLDARIVKNVLGAIIVAFALYALARRAPLHLREDRWPWLLGCGFAAGILGGAYGMNGPPLVVYGSLRRWSAERFRATLQAYFLPASMLGMAGYWVAGLWVPLVTRYYLLSLPGTIVAIVFGRFINRKMRGEQFVRWTYVGLVLTGLALLVQANRG
jgi:uncharacterized membrane protein YfcA